MKLKKYLTLTSRLKRLKRMKYAKYKRETEDLSQVVELNNALDFYAKESKLNTLQGLFLTVVTTIGINWLFSDHFGFAVLCGLVVGSPNYILAFKAYRKADDLLTNLNYHWA